MNTATYPRARCLLSVSSSWKKNRFNLSSQPSVPLQRSDFPLRKSPSTSYPPAYKRGQNQKFSSQLQSTSFFKAEKTILPLPMGQNCNLDLSLLPTGDGERTGTGARSVVGSPHSAKPKSEESTGNSEPLMIFYDGRVCSCDVTEIQARVILYLAKREMEEKFKVGCSEPLSPCRKPGFHAPSLSLKRSLQQFLQKRKSRINRTCPYHA